MVLGCRQKIFLASATLILAVVLVFGVLLRVKNAVFRFQLRGPSWNLSFLISPEGFNDAYPMFKSHYHFLGMAVL